MGDRVSSGDPGVLKTLDSVSTIIGMSRRKKTQNKTNKQKKPSSKSKVGTEPKETESKN